MLANGNRAFLNQKEHTQQQQEEYRIALNLDYVSNTIFKLFRVGPICDCVSGLDKSHVRYLTKRCIIFSLWCAIVSPLARIAPINDASRLACSHYFLLLTTLCQYI